MEQGKEPAFAFLCMPSATGRHHLQFSVSSSAHSWAGRMNEVMGGGVARHTDVATLPQPGRINWSSSVPQTGLLCLCAQAIFATAHCLCAFIHLWYSSYYVLCPVIGTTGTQRVSV